MLLLLMRHGIAEDVPQDSEDDTLRRLTPEGRRRVRAIADMMRVSGHQPTHYAASPRIRAHQTAEVVMEVFGGGRIETLDSLDFDGTWRSLVRDISALTAESQDAVVLAAGHEPNCSSHLTESLFGSPLSFEFKKGAVAALRWDGPIDITGARLEFYWTWGMVKGMKDESELIDIRR